jgi:hypothetical protein
MTADHLLSQWVIAAVLLLVGANMLIEPDNFAAVIENLGTGIRNFEHQWRGPIWRNYSRFHWRRRHLVMPVSRTAVRVVGLIALVVGLLAAMLP